MEDKTWIKDREGKNLIFHREMLLNYAMNRWGLNGASTVGSTSELIRRCAPKTYKEWVDYYFENALWELDENKTKITRGYIRSLGQMLYINLSEVVRKELNDIMGYDRYIYYVYGLFSSENQTCKGYNSTGFGTIYDELVDILKLYSLGNTYGRYRDSDYRASDLASKRFYLKYSKVIDKELSNITEEECIDYVYNWVLNRTYEEYINRPETICNQLEDLLNVEIEMDAESGIFRFDYIEWLDFQIKPVSADNSLNDEQWNQMCQKNRKKSKIFVVYYSIDSGGKKQIQNTEEIKKEIARLQLRDLLGIKIELVEDECKKYNVDFIIPIETNIISRRGRIIYYLGIQFKPISDKSLDDEQRHQMYQENLEKFNIKKVFVVYYSIDLRAEEQIQNIEVIEEIKTEIEEILEL